MWQSITKHKDQWPVRCILTLQQGAFLLLLAQRGKYWWFRFTAPNGQRIFHSARTADKRLAQEYADRLKADLWRQAKLQDKPDFTWKDAVVRLLRETAMIAQFGWKPNKPIYYGQL